MRARRAVAALLLATALGGSGRAEPAAPPEPAPSAAEAELLRAEERRQRAMVDGDVAALGALLAAELRFTHANGVRQTRGELLAALASGRLDYVSAAARGAEARVFGDAGVVTGAADLAVRAAGGPEQALRLVYTAVYARSGGAWRLVAYQSTRAPEGAAR